jgi:hypothetical protein
MTPRRFPPPWSAELTPNCFIVRDANGQALTYIYYESEPGRRSAAKLLSKDEARRIAVNIGKLTELLGRKDLIYRGPNGGNCSHYRFRQSSWLLLCQRLLRNCLRVHIMYPVQVRQARLMMEPCRYRLQSMVGAVCAELSSRRRLVPLAFREATT